MKTMLILFGLRPSNVGLATRRHKGDIISAALQRDRDVRDLQFAYPRTDQHRHYSDSYMREAV